jgi:hypothetical protein
MIFANSFCKNENKQLKSLLHLQDINMKNKIGKEATGKGKVQKYRYHENRNTNFGMELIIEQQRLI